jgi:protoporphyrinogen oxidase
MKKETLYIVGAGLLGLTIGYFLYKPKTTEEPTSSFAGSTKSGCITKEQFACLSSAENRRKLVSILKECGLSAEQISLYLRANKKMLSNRICK